MDTDALLLSRFMLKRHGDLFDRRSCPIPVIRINWTSSFYYPLSYRKGFTTIATEVEEAPAPYDLSVTSTRAQINGARATSDGIGMLSNRQKARRTTRPVSSIGATSYEPRCPDPRWWISTR